MINSKFNTINLISISILFIVLLVLSVLVATRDFSGSSDTIIYKDFFDNVEFYNNSRFEILFKYLTLGVRFITDKYVVYFGFIFLLFTSLYVSFYYSILGEDRKITHLFIFFGLMLSSSWYVVATLNGLRQGFSLPLLYFSLLFFSKRKFIISIIFFLVSFGFHYSVILTLPFIALVFQTQRFVLFSFVISSLLYTLGISELLVKLVSDLLSISLYQDISNFGEGKNYRQGFQFDLFLYSFSWGPIFYILQRYVRVCYLENYIRVWKFYCVLIMPYFFFGF